MHTKKLLVFRYGTNSCLDFIVEYQNIIVKRISVKIKQKILSFIARNQTNVSLH